MSGPAAGEEAIRSTETTTSVKVVSLWAERTTPSVLSWSVGADVRDIRRRSLWDGDQVLVIAVHIGYITVTGKLASGLHCRSR